MSSYTLSRWITIERFDDFAVVNTSTLRRYLKPATGTVLIYCFAEMENFRFWLKTMDYSKAF